MLYALQVKLGVLLVTLDSQLTFSDPVSGVVRACNLRTRALRYICSLVARETAYVIECSIAGNRLDYCNSVWYGIMAPTINRLRRV